MTTTINNEHKKLNVPNSTDKGNTIRNAPHLRFPEFTGEWEEATLGSVAKVVGGGTPDTNIQKYWNGNIQWFTPSEIGRDKYVTYSLRTISEEGLNKSSAKILPTGTILLSSRATVGECSMQHIRPVDYQYFINKMVEKSVLHFFLR